MKVFIDGKAGTTGLGIFDRLKARGDVDLLVLDEERRKDVSARKEKINAADVVFLCLPDDAAREAVTLCENPDTVIIDASTAHRTEESWAYGFPELSEEFRERIIHSKRIANPGCYASGFLSIVYPLLKEGVIGEDYPVVCHAVSGYSGAGKKGIEQYQTPDELLRAPRLYALGLSHKHVPEMMKISGLKREPVFQPYICNFYAGMTVSIPLFSDLLKTKLSPNQIFELFAEYYVRHKYIKITQNSENGFLSAAKLVGTNDIEIFVGGNDKNPLLVARLDNLGKGASGAAIQNMNLASGLDESLGL